MSLIVPRLTLLLRYLAYWIGLRAEPKMGLAEVAGMGVDDQGVTRAGGRGSVETRLASWNFRAFYSVSNIVIQSVIRYVICSSNKSLYQLLCQTFALPVTQ